MCRHLLVITIMLPQAGTKSCLRFEAHGKDKVFALTVLESTNSNAVKITFVLQGPIYMDKRIKNVQLSCFFLQLQAHLASHGDQQLAECVHKIRPHKASVRNKGVGA